MEKSEHTNDKPNQKATSLYPDLSTVLVRHSTADPNFRGSKIKERKHTHFNILNKDWENEKDRSF